MKARIRAFVVLASVLFAGVAWANSGGITGRSGKQGQSCNSCHQGGKVPTVKLDGPTALDAGTVAVYTFHIQTDAAITGMNAAATDGVIMVGDEDAGSTYLDYNEVTHTRTVKPDAATGEAVYSFSIKPQYGGKIKLYAAGNACNNNQNTDGDEAATTTFEVDVNGPPKPDPPEAGPPPPKPPPAPVDDAGSVVATDSGINGDATPDEPSAPSDDSGCSVGFLGDSSSSLPASGMAVFAGLALLGRARRRRRR